MQEFLHADIIMVIPAYNSAHCLPAILKSLLEKVPAHQILIIDDGSTDGTFIEVQNLQIACVRHPQNQGKGSALSTGLQAANERGFKWMLSLDADGQHALADIVLFNQASQLPGAGIIVGQRPIGGEMPWHRRFSNWLTTAAVSQLAGRPVFDAQCGYRLYLSELASLLPIQGRFEWEAQALILCTRLGYKVQAVPVQTIYTGNGSHMQIIPDTLRFLKMMWILLWTTGIKRANNS